MTAIQTATNQNTFKNSGNRFKNILPVNAREVNRPFNKFRNALLFGSLGGLTLGLTQFLLLGIQPDANIGIGLWGFALITPFIYLGLKRYKKHLAGGEVFKNGIIQGLLISTVASIMMVLIENVGIAWQQEMIQEASVSHLIVNGSFQLLEGIVFGMIFTFVILQGLKSDMRADKNIEKQA